MIDNDLRIRRLLQEARDPRWPSSCWMWSSATGRTPTRRRAGAGRAQRRAPLAAAAGRELVVGCLGHRHRGGPAAPEPPGADAGRGRGDRVRQQRRGSPPGGWHRGSGKSITRVRYDPCKKSTISLASRSTVINVGLGSMAQAVQAQGVPVIDLDWQPPAEGVPRLHHPRRAWTSRLPMQKSAGASSRAGRCWWAWASPGT